MSEKDYFYEPIQKFIKEKYNCFFVTQCDGKRGGKQVYGFADVLGISYKNNEKTAIEVIGVEVKNRKEGSMQRFWTSKGILNFLP